MGGAWAPVLSRSGTAYNRSVVRWVLLGWILAPLLGLAADLTPPQLLSRIRNQMAQTLARLPDYTCRETIERSVQQPHSNRLENLDILYVDVAHLNGRELYAWPGARLGEHNLLEMVPDGSIGTGNFGMLARAVFADYGPIFLFQGRSIENGRSQVRFSFQVPLANSTYAIHYGSRNAIVPYHGWFTVDPDSNDVIVFQVEANEIPRNLETLQAIEHIEYARSRIGGREYLLPATSDTLLMDLKGEVSRNHITFERCQQYAGESTVTFTDPGEVTTAQPSPAAPQPLPTGVELRLRLTAPIQQGVTAIGDRISAELTKEVRRPVALPKGTAVTLRVIAMETLTIGRAPIHVLKVQLIGLQVAGRQYEITGANLEAVRWQGRFLFQR
jgi:hypothetical protein